MPIGNQGPTNSGGGANQPATTSADPKDKPQPRESALREVTHVKVATRCAKEKNVRTTIDLKRPWYYSA